MNFFKTTLFFAIVVFLIPVVTLAFIGPGIQAPGEGGGLLFTTSDRNIGFGTSDLAPGNKAEGASWGYLFTIASSSNPGLSLYNTGGGRRYVIYSHNSGALGIYDTSAGGGVRFRIAPNGRIAIGGTVAPDELLHVFGTAKANLFSGDGSSLTSITPGNVSGGAFANFNYAFRQALAVGTSTTAGLPVGGLYVDGRVGIGTMSPNSKLEVVGNITLGTNGLIGKSSTFGLQFGGADYAFKGSSGDVVLISNSAPVDSLRILSSGNVGIGTASPGEKLHVNGLIRIERATATDNDSPGIVAVSNDDFLYNGVYLNHYGLGFHTPINQTNRGVYASGYFGIDLFTQGINRLSILQNGNVGIATTTPASPLTVVGVIESTFGGFKFPDGTTQTSAIGAGESGWTDDGTTVRLTDIGDNVGIGTAGPSDKLQVAGNVRVGLINSGAPVANSAGNSLYLSGAQDTSATWDSENSDPLYIQRYNSGDNTTDFRIVVGDDNGSSGDRLTIGPTTDLTKFVFRMDGRLGIGTASPQSTLHINGSAADLSIENSAGGRRWRLIPNTDGTFAIRDQTVAATRITVDTAGNVGIGTTSPGELLEVYGDTQNIKINNTAETEAGIIFEDAQGGGLQYAKVLFNSNDVSPNNLLNFYVDSATAAMTINGSGNVGIGTTNPTYKLDVVGTARFSQPVIVGAPFIDEHAATQGYVKSTVGTGTFWAQSGSNLYPENLTWNVGIGTASPQDELHINASGAGIRLTDPADAGYVALTIDSNGFGRLISFDSGIGIFSNNVEVLRVTGGNVGINTITPREFLSIGGTSDPTLLIGDTSGGNLADSGKIAFSEDINQATPIERAYIKYDGSANKLHIGTQEIGDKAFTIERITGNVGIGTASPGYKLHVVGGNVGIPNNGYIYATGTGELRLGNTNGGLVAVGGTGGVSYIESISNPLYLQTTRSSDNLALLTNNTVALTILGSNQNVGIGTTNPTYKLDVAGIARFTQPVIVGAPFLDEHAATQGYVKSTVGTGTFWAQSGSNLYPENLTWNVGIGTTDPGYKLDVSGVSAATDTFQLSKYNSIGNAFEDYYLKVGPLGSSYRNHKARLNVRGESYWASEMVLTTQGDNGNEPFDLKVDGDLFIRTSGTSGGSNKILLNNDGDSYFNGGNVGIGLTGPTYNLHVAGTFSAASEITTIDNLGNITAKSFLDFDDANFKLDPSNTGTSLSVAGVISAIGSGNNYFAGNVGIGTTGPNEKLDVVGDIYFNYNALIAGQATQTTNVDHIWSDDGSLNYGGNTIGNWQFSHDQGYKALGNSALVAGNVWMRNNNDNYFAGRVGIGTPSPATALEINGVLTFTAPGGGTAINVNNGDIIGVDKLAVTTIDPLYNIGGTKYATYVASFAGGVKEEFVGKAKLSFMNYESGIRNYEYVIDFDNLERGSDLWLWHKTVDFSEENVEVLVTPYKVPVPVAYEIDGNRIIFRAVVHDSLSMIPDSITFSYRLVGKRFDWRKWPTLAPNQSEKANLVIE